MEDKLVFTLKTPLEVQVTNNGKNEFLNIDKLYLSAPTYKHRDNTIGLKKRFIEAIFAMTNSLSKKEAESATGESESELDTKAIKAILYAAKDFDIVSFFNEFTKFLIKDIAFKDEEMKQPLKGAEIEKINENDFEDLIAKYIEVFFASSWMKTLS